MTHTYANADGIGQSYRLEPGQWHVLDVALTQAASVVGDMLRVQRVSGPLFASRTCLSRNAKGVCKEYSGELPVCGRQSTMTLPLSDVAPAVHRCANPAQVRGFRFTHPSR